MTTAIVFICDLNFLAPTAGAALSARRHTTDQKTEVLIYLTQGTDTQIAAIQTALSPDQISVRRARLPSLDLIDPATFNPTHVPLSTLARLWLDELLDPHIDKFLYLDGDIDITDSLDPLLALSPPAGGFLAAPDQPILLKGKVSRSSREALTYLRGLGLACAQDYFNAGVLLAERDGWGAISRKARVFFQTSPHLCRYHDQSALNAVAGSAREPLSLLWNYQTDFMAITDPGEWGAKPCIWHFTGFPKPWHAPAFPWTGPFGHSYQLGTERLRNLSLGTRTADPLAIAKGCRSRETLKVRLKWVYPWRKVSRTRTIKSLLRSDLARL